MSDGPPTNAELAEQVARLEENVAHVAETADRIEKSVNEDHAELATQVGELGERTRTLWTLYCAGRFGIKWGVPTLAGVLASGAALGVV